MTGDPRGDAGLADPLGRRAERVAHAPAALLLVVALRLLLAARRPATLVAAGCALAAMVACCIPMIVFALPLAACRRPCDAPRLLAPLAVGAVTCR